MQLKQQINSPVYFPKAVVLRVHSQLCISSYSDFSSFPMFPHQSWWNCHHLHLQKFCWIGHYWCKFACLRRNYWLFLSFDTIWSFILSLNQLFNFFFVCFVVVFFSWLFNLYFSLYWRCPVFWKEFFCKCLQDKLCLRLSSLSQC